MAYIEWTDQLSVHNPVIDSEHKKLVQILNNLHDSMKKGEGSKVLGSTLEQLVLYTKTHFKNEEGIMARNNYIHLAGHKKQHNEFIAEIDKQYAKFKAGSLALTIELITFLRNWLVDHIQGSDKKFGETMKAA